MTRACRVSGLVQHIGAGMNVKRLSTNRICTYTWILALSVFIAAAQAEEKTRASSRIAVLYFQNNSSDNQSLNALSKGLCSMMITDLKSSGGLTVVERERIQDVLSELKMEQGAAFDRDTAAKLGRLVGAEYLVFGSYFELFDTFTINARIVVVETGIIAGASGVSGKTANFGQLQQQVTLDLIEKMRPVFGTPESEVLRGGASPVTVTEASAYGQALDEHDQGKNTSARKILLDIVEANPRFDAARTMLDQLTPEEK